MRVMHEPAHMFCLCVHAGTDSRVYVQLQGRAGATTRLWLGPGGLGAGQTAELAFRWSQLGELQQLVVGSDGSGSVAPGWHLDYAEVEQCSNGQARGRAGARQAMGWGDLAGAWARKTRSGLDLVEPALPFLLTAGDLL